MLKITTDVNNNLCMLDTNFAVWLWPQLSWSSRMYMLDHSIEGKFLK